MADVDRNEKYLLGVFDDIIELMATQGQKVVCGRLFDIRKLIESKQAEIDRMRQPKWTYASEGMPKYEYYGQKFWVYTQYKKTNGEVGGRQVQLLRWERTTIRGKTVERFKTLWDAVVYDEVIAWMPLKEPEPPMMDQAGG